MIQGTISPRRRMLLGLLATAVLLGLYTGLAYRQHAKNPLDTTIPTWGQLGQGIAKACTPDEIRGERWLVEDARATGLRLLIGLAIGVGGGIVLGVLMGCFPTAEALLTPPLKFFSRIIPTAALAVFFVVVGTGTPMYATMIVFGILPGLALAVALGVREFPEELLHKTYTLGDSHFEVIWNAIFRYVLPRVIEQVKLSLGPAMVYLMAAELLVGDVGMGYRIRILSRRLEMQVVYPYLIFLAAFGFGIEYVLDWLQARLSPWHKPRGRKRS